MHTDHGAAVNLDVLLLKAKALDVEKIREEVKEASTTKKSSTKVKKVSETKSKPKPKPKKTATPKEKPKKEVKPKIEEKTVDENELLKQFEEETGKKAIWRGKETKGYLDWKNEKLG
jgi:outer membrane biosynthesis protein TonB